MSGIFHQWNFEKNREHIIKLTVLINKHPDGNTGHVKPVEYSIE